MAANRRYPSFVVLVLLGGFLPGAWAQGPKKEYFYNAAMELTWAKGEIYQAGGSKLKISFLPVISQRAPLGTDNYSRDIAVDAPLVFIGNGIVKDDEWNSYRGRRLDYTTGDIDVSGKAVIFCYDFPDKLEEKLKAEFILEKRIAEAAQRKAAAVILFSAQEEFPFLVARFPQGAEIPQIPAITVTKSSVHDFFLGNVDVGDASLLQKWRESGVPPEPVELNSRVRLRIDGAFPKVETENFLLRARSPEVPGDSLEKIAGVNELALKGLRECFRDDQGLKWKKSLVVYFRDYDSKVFYTHHWGRGLSSDEGSYMIHSGGIPDIGLAAHENAHMLIGSNWGESTSFLSEGIGRYAEAQASKKDMNDQRVVQFLRSGELFPLEDMLTFLIGTGGLKTEVGYPASGSFVDFLIQKYGLNALKEAYALERRTEEEKEKDDTWRRVFGKSIQDLEKDWLMELKTKYRIPDEVITTHLKKSAAPKTVYTVDIKVLDSLTGQYAVSGGMVLTVSSENGQLFLGVPNMGKLALTPESEMMFSVQGMDATATFIKDEKGDVTQLIFHTPAGDLLAKRTDRLKPGGRRA
ncbi:MAG: DUF3471 domain-containing protein [Candidatus Aminicenantales bacterium]